MSAQSVAARAEADPASEVRRIVTLLDRVPPLMSLADATYYATTQCGERKLQEGHIIAIAQVESMAGAIVQEAVESLERLADRLNGKPEVETT